MGTFDDIFPVPISVWAVGSGFFVSADGSIVTAGHVIFCFTHKDITQDLYIKYFLIETAFFNIVQELEDAGYYFTLEELELLWTDGYTAKSETAIINVSQTQGPTLGDAWVIILLLIVVVGA